MADERLTDQLANALRLCVETLEALGRDLAREGAPADVVTALADVIAASHLVLQAHQMSTQH